MEVLGEEEEKGRRRCAYGGNEREAEIHVEAERETRTNRNQREPDLQAHARGRSAGGRWRADTLNMSRRI